MTEGLRDLFEFRCRRVWQHYRQPLGCGNCMVRAVLPPTGSSELPGCEKMQQLIRAAQSVIPMGASIYREIKALDDYFRSIEKIDEALYMGVPKRPVLPNDPHAEGKRVLGQALQDLFG